jgi:hypothetical protein
MLPPNVPLVAVGEYQMTTIRVTEESDSRTGWTHSVSITNDEGRVQTLTVTLCYQDYEYWSGGSRPPERVTEALIESLLAPEEGSKVPRPLPEKFDASTARRWMPEIDHALRSGSWH